ncbi:MAG TPA: CGNR zinc finger domain-containing protein [Acidimicrobiales bacterium]|jgi:predicted RNA-binding Zn ribbon-like protein|nr:CGNR zinc finger domain-containing protein [Acidimicrobiales bacterium]
MSLVKALFTHDTQVALEGAAALVNTVGRAGDELTDESALDRFVDTWRWTGDRTHDAYELESVRALRPRLRRLWQQDTDAVVEQVNGILRTVKALPQLVRHDGWDWHLHATSQDAPLAERMAVEAAMALIDVVRQGELRRLRTCAATDCDDVYVDMSRNSSKRYCSTTCANRVNMAAFRSRRNEPGADRSGPEAPVGD